MFIKLYSKVNRDHCVASIINFKSIIIQVRKKDFLFFFFFFCVNK